MKNYIKYGLMLLAACVFTSCLESGLDKLEAFDECDITDVKFEFRYKDMGDIWIDGEPIVKIVNLTVKDKALDANAGTITCSLEVPEANGPFTNAIRNTVSLNNIVGKFNLSTAASVKPIDGAPTLGIPGDFSSDRRYQVTAADGKNKKVWTIRVTGLNK